MRIVHAPKNPSGLATTLAEAERLHGHEVVAIASHRSFTGVRADRNLGLDRYRGIRYVLECAKAAGSHPDADVTNLWFGATYLHYPRFGVNQADLRMLARRSTIVATYVGSDARIGSEHSAALQQATLDQLRGIRSPAALRWHERGQRLAMRKMSRHARHIFAVNPDLLRWLHPEQATFLPYPVRAPSQPKRDTGRDGPLRVLHAPTNRALKGTDLVVAAVRRVQEEAPTSIDFTILDRADRGSFLDELARTDLYIDQLLIGWYGVAAVEAMLIGTPVVCFIDDRDLDVVPRGMAEALPVVSTDGPGLAQVLRGLVKDRSPLERARDLGRCYAQRWHNPDWVASITIDRYRELAK